jgi:hypothetical protein
MQPPPPRVLSRALLSSAWRPLPTALQVPSSLAWHPKGEALLIAGEGGSVGLWAGAVPPGSGLPSPWQAPDEVLRHADAAAAAGASGRVARGLRGPGGRCCPSARRKGERLTGKDVADCGASGRAAGAQKPERRTLPQQPLGASTAAGTTMDDGGEDSMAGGLGARRLKRRAGAAASAGALEDEGLLDEDLEDVDDEGAAGDIGRTSKRARGVAAAGGGLLRPGAAAAALMAAPAPRLPKTQAPVQPGATPEAEGSTGRFLAYNSIGCVISRKVDSHRTCEVRCEGEGGAPGVGGEGGGRTRRGTQAGGCGAAMARTRPAWASPAACAAARHAPRPAHAPPAAFLPPPRLRRCCSTTRPGGAPSCRC